VIRLALISNPRSRRNRRGLEEVEGLARRRGVVCRRLEPGVAPQEVLADLARHEVSVLAINGGDGTVQRLLTALTAERRLDPPPVLAVLAGGTTNLIAHDLGLLGRPCRGLTRLLELAAGGRIERFVRKRPVMRVENLTGAGPQCGMFLAAAALARAITAHREREGAAILGGFPTALAMAHMLADLCRREAARKVLRGEPVGIALDGGRAAHACRLLVFVTSLERLVFSSRPYWNQTGAPLRLTSVACRPRRLLRSTLRVLAGGDPSTLPADSYASGSAARVDLRPTTALALDGEIFTPQPSTPVTVTATVPFRFLAC